MSLDGEHVKKNKKIYFEISNFCQQLLFYYFTRVDVKRLTYKIPKAFICPTVPFIIKKKFFRAILKIKRKQREERKFT